MGLGAFTELINQRIKELTPIQTAYATCVSVDWENKTMVAKGQTDDLEYYDIDLGRGAEYKKPKVNTLCLIGLIENNPANAFLLDAAELEELNFKTGTTELTVKESGVIIKSGNEDLKTVFNDMIDELNKIVVIYGNTINVVAMETIKQRLNTILKSS
ncbi:hypothetical protein NBRC110019_07400 [Neptunitalea chrysea]|uniref:Uncharacterized protein n=1 Tax=Neptunitalea chrysea TaxID=1647581 RepID=A0A9W6B3E3_9FLAO|nr:hypothetical protein [Neptunitalea chrysea]GLB51701.1 hypothetical protein NBRC110019_07400 [Neptunitalea chrysea]